jgi:hypothetical protein
MSAHRIGHVYFIQALPDGLIKIGYTAAGPDLRFLRHQASSPVPLRPLGTMEGSVRTELSIHRKFRDVWSHGEWFHPAPELIAFIELKSSPWTPRPLAFRRSIGAGRNVQPCFKEWAESTVLTYHGRSLTAAKWAKKLGIPAAGIKLKMDRYGDVAHALRYTLYPKQHM